MRNAEIQHKTRETDLSILLELDGTGQSQIQTGIGFLDHLLTQVALHGRFDLSIKTQGDLHVDAHHTVEDCALVFGQAMDQALGDRAGIIRVGSSHVPMDDALAFVAVDFSGRPYTVVEAEWGSEMLGTMPCSLVPHFLRSFANTARANLHARLFYGRDNHHKSEALFKAFGRALENATRLDSRLSGVIPSTKGTL